MTKDEAIHKALKVLNCLNNDRVYETAWVKGAINACEEALKQPAQKPVFWMHEVEEAPFEGHQVTVAPEQGDYYTIPLYTHPHQWQGLTDDEIVDWFEECFGHDEISETTMWFAKRLLDAVKEKNCG